MTDGQGIVPDMELVKKLRKDFSAKTCVEALMDSAVKISAAIGVKVSWELISVNKDKVVNKSELTLALGELTTASGAVLLGAKVNPISILKKENPIRTLREKEKE